MKKFVVLILIMLFAGTAAAEQYITCTGYEGGCKKKMVCEWRNDDAKWHCWCMCGAYRELSQDEMDRQMKLEEANQDIIKQGRKNESARLIKQIRQSDVS